MFVESPNLDGGCQGKSLENVLCNSTAFGVLTVDAEGKITAVTSEAERALHRPGSKEPLRLQDLPAPLQVIIQDVQRTGQAVTNRQIVFPSAGSVARTTTVNAVLSSLAQHAGVVVTLKSDSSSAELERTLRHLDRLASIGTFSASMTHEIKNAFVAVRTFVELLLEKNPDAELAGVVRREISRVDSIVSHMLKFAAPARPAFNNIHLHELLEHSLRLVEHGTENKLISFHREFMSLPDAFFGDDHQLEQAFVNLLFNAVEAMPAEGALTVSTDLVSNNNGGELREAIPSDEFLRITISDTGVGIAPEKLDHIFEPFFTTKPNGTGLGLAVTRRIIREHHGSINVESSLNQGARFVVLLPARSLPKRDDAR
jgi:signal transduction histidine kinase